MAKRSIIKGLYLAYLVDVAVNIEEVHKGPVDGLLCRGGSEWRRGP